MLNVTVTLPLVFKEYRIRLQGCKARNRAPLQQGHWDSMSGQSMTVGHQRGERVCLAREPHGEEQSASRTAQKRPALMGPLRGPQAATEPLTWFTLRGLIGVGFTLVAHPNYLGSFENYHIDLGPKVPTELVWGRAWLVSNNASTACLCAACWPHFQLFQDSTCLAFNSPQNMVLDTLSCAPRSCGNRKGMLPASLLCVGLGHSGETPCYSGMSVLGIGAKAVAIRRKNSNVATGGLVDLKTRTQLL